MKRGGPASLRARASAGRRAQPGLFARRLREGPRPKREARTPARKAEADCPSAECLSTSDRAFAARGSEPSRGVLVNNAGSTAPGRWSERPARLEDRPIVRRRAAHWAGAHRREARTGCLGPMRCWPMQQRETPRAQAPTPNATCCDRARCAAGCQAFPQGHEKATGRTGADSGVFGADFRHPRRGWGANRTR